MLKTLIPRSDDSLGLNPDHKLPRVSFILINRVHGALTHRFPHTLKAKELIRPVTIVSFVNALLFATRLMMSGGAMTCTIRRHIGQPVEDRGHGKART